MKPFFGLIFINYDIVILESSKPHKQYKIKLSMNLYSYVTFENCSFLTSWQVPNLTSTWHNSVFLCFRWGRHTVALFTSAVLFLIWHGLLYFSSSYYEKRSWVYLFVLLVGMTLFYWRLHSIMCFSGKMYQIKYGINE